MKITQPNRILIGDDFNPKSFRNTPRQKRTHSRTSLSSFLIPLVVVLLTLSGCGSGERPTPLVEKENRPAGLPASKSSNHSTSPSPAPGASSRSGAYTVIGGDPSAGARIDPHLYGVVSDMRRDGVTRENARDRHSSRYSNRRVRVSDDAELQTYIYLERFGEAERAALESHQARIEVVNENLNIVQAALPFDRIDTVAHLPFVKKMTPPSYHTRRSTPGSKTTEGDAILKTDRLHALGFDGASIRVGVISDGATHHAASEASGDLPSITVVDFLGNGDEGTAMLEIVHDLAPGATLGFCGPLTNLEMIRCVADLSETFGADVIVDDLGFFEDPYFEDGPVAKAVAQAVAAGVVYVCAAGNDADAHYQAKYADSGRSDLHDFGGGDISMPLAGPFGQAIVYLQWSDPVGRVIDNYDLCKMEADGSALTCSGLIQSGNETALEILMLDCADPNGCSGNIGIRKVSGSAQTLEMFFINTAPQQYNVPEDSVFGQSAVEGAVAVGAIDAADPGQIDIEPFSSFGPSTILFPAEAHRLKPDVVAVDGVTITGAGGRKVPFFGTSAAAPHVAGIAALLKEVPNENGSAAAAEIVAALKGSAVDLGAPGVDPVYGAGRVDALVAAQIVDSPPKSVIDSPESDLTITQGESVRFSGSCVNPISTAGMRFLWSFGQDSGIPNAETPVPGEAVFAHAGAFEVRLNCTDGLGKTNSAPAIRTITVKPPAATEGRQANGGGGGGGGCAARAAASGPADSDAILVLLLGVAGLSLFRKKIRERAG